MRRHLAAPLAAAALITAPAPAGAIVGGGPADPGEYPYVANVEIAGAGGCTGSLVAPRWVVTAGHCASVLGPAGVPTPMELPPESFRVTLGTVNADGDDDRTGAAEEHAVRSVHVHPDYAATNGVGSDVALLELADASRVAPVRIAAPDEGGIWEPGDELTIAGFGVTEEDGEAPDRLQETTVPRIADPQCAEAYGDTTPVVGNAFDPRTALCAGLPEGGRDTCQGDSGGPLLAPLGSGFRLVGATSYGEGCAREGLPGVYARLAEGSVKAFVAGLVPGAYAGGARTCAGAPGLTVRIRGRGLRRVVVRVDGRRVLRRTGRPLKPFTLRLARRLPRAGTATVRIVIVRAGAPKRTITRTYTACRRA
jgi:trypsin